MVWQVVSPACLACRPTLRSIKVHMLCRLAPLPIIPRLLRRGQLVAKTIPLILQRVQLKAMPPLPANHTGPLACRCLCLSLQRIREVQQQVLRIQSPIRTKDNRHVHQPCCAGCFLLTCRAVRKRDSNREDGVNNRQSSSAYLAHTQHLPVVTSCHLQDPAFFRVAAPLTPPTMAGKPPCAFCSLEVVVPLCAFCRNIFARSLRFTVCIGLGSFIHTN